MSHQQQHQQQQQSTAVRVFSSFDEMPLNQLLLRGVYAHGFEKPSPIQSQAIVPTIQGGDIIAQAQSGTGKTGAFSIAVLQRLDLRRAAAGNCQALILEPTRELAQQTYDEVRAIGDYLADGSASFCQMFVGGTRVGEDVKRLQAGVTVAVGTPGRVADLIRRGALRTSALRTLVLDEADEMLSQGFSDQVHDVFKYLPKDIQVALFSATMPPDVLNLSAKFMRDPTRILVNKESLTLDGIKQFYVAVEEEAKLATVMDLYESISIAQSVIFVSSRAKVEWVAQELNANHHTVSWMHADMGRGEREKVMATFRSGSSRVLVTTDLVARGIDVQHVNIVINFDLPSSKEVYLHRIGRSGRYGRKGVAINLVSSRAVGALREIEDHYKREIEELPMDFATFLGEE